MRAGQMKAALALGVAVSLAGLAAPTRAADTRPLVVARNMDITSLDPARSFCDTCQIYLSAVYQTLVTLAADNKTLAPNLATSWEVSPDQTRFVFKLAPNAVFSDGAPVTSADVAWSLTRLKNMKADASFLMEALTGVETPDDKTVVLRTAQPNSEFLNMLASSYAGIINRKVAEANGAAGGENASTADQADNWFFANSAGSGPYKLALYRNGDQLRLVANDKFWGTAPKVAEVIVKQVPDAVAQLQLLQTGGADVAMQIDPDTAASVKDQNLVLDTVPSYNFIYLALGVGSKANTVPLTKPIREAIAAAIDYQGLIDFTVGGKGRPQPVAIPNGFPGTTDLPIPKQDLALAKAKLAEAGQPNGFTMKSAFPAVNSYGVDLSLMMQKLQQDLGRVGIKLELEPITFAVWRERVAKDGIPITASYYAPDYFGTVQYVQFFSMMPASSWVKRSHADKVQGVVNEKEGALLKQALAATPTEAEKIYREIALEMIGDKVIIPVVSPDLILASRKGVTGVRYSACCNLALSQVGRE
jgi:peptide/nickel transport system substrate-binding protein